MALREHRELVLLVHFQNVGFEQRVVHAAREAYAVVREDVGIELDVLADFLAVVALEPWLQCFRATSIDACAGAPR